MRQLCFKVVSTVGAQFGKKFLCSAVLPDGIGAARGRLDERPQLLRRRGRIASKGEGQSAVQARLEVVGREGDGPIEERNGVARAVALHEQRAEAVERIRVTGSQV